MRPFLLEVRMSKLKDVVNEIREEAENIEDKAKLLNAQLDTRADEVLEKAQKSPLTGAGILLAILVVIIALVWFLLR